MLQMNGIPENYAKQLKATPAASVNA